MKVCLDTNVLIRLFVPHPPFDRILDALLNGRITILVSNEILLEYQEVVVREFGSNRWRKIETLLDTIDSLFGTINRVHPQFRFGVIHIDDDDNKFVDCAISGEADFVATYDTHFAAMRGSGYKPQPITPDALSRLI